MYFTIPTLRALDIYYAHGAKDDATVKRRERSWSKSSQLGEQLHCCRSVVPYTGEKLGSCIRCRYSWSQVPVKTNKQSRLCAWRWLSSISGATAWMTRKCGREVRGRHHCVLKISELTTSAYKALAENHVYQSQYVGAMCSFVSNVYSWYTLSSIICSPVRCQCLGGAYPRSSLWTNVQNSRKRAYNPIGSTEIWGSPVAASVVKPEYKLFQFRVSRNMSMAAGPDDSARLFTRIKWYIQAETLPLDPNFLQQGQPLRDSGGQPVWTEVVVAHRAIKIGSTVTGSPSCQATDTLAKR